MSNGERPDWDPIKARGLFYCPHCGAKMDGGT